MNRIHSRLSLLAAFVVASLLQVLPAVGQPAPQRTLGREDIKVYGIGLKVAPATQTVPKDIATIVSTFLQASTLPDNVPPFAADAEVVATLRGPSFATPVELRVKPNSPFNIPPMTVPGTHILENIRLVSGGEVLLRGVPDRSTIEVIEKLLVTQVTARALTAAEIREKGIVFDKDNFQAYNFSAAFAIADQPINLNFPVVLPRLEGAADVGTGTATIPAITAPSLPALQTIIPDTLKLQTKIPNLTVVGFTLKVPQLTGQQLVVPPIPGVVVIPGDIGFLNQYFSVMLMVGNVAPAGSNLVVSNLQATIVLPPGNDGVANSVDDPLRMAQTTQGESPRVRLVAQPGPDGKVGTADDILTLGPGDSGNAEYLVEGRREGSHVVEMQMTGTLNGLPAGPVTITGRAAGSVLVRNPKFTLTFTHPDVVSAGEAYKLDVTVTNTSQAPANFVSLNLYPRNVSGATVVGESTRGIESVLPGDSQTVTFTLLSRVSGKVTAATLDSNENVAGRFLLKAAVGELGVPLSPDSLVLPKEANSLPGTLRDAALGLLGKAHAVATAPAAALPPDVRRFSRKIVIDRAVQVAEAGMRVSLHEPIPTSASQLLMDVIGSDVSRLATLFPKPEDQQFEKDNFDGFDELRRRSVRGDRFADAVAALLTERLNSVPASQFLTELSQGWSYRPGHVAVLVSGNGSPLPARFILNDSQNRRVGANGAENKVIKEIPYSDVLDFTDASGRVTARLLLLAAPQPGTFRISSEPVDGVAANTGYTISIVAPEGSGALTQYTSATLQYPEVPQSAGSGATPYQFLFDGGTANGAVLTASAIADPAPTVISVVQQADADVLRCLPEDPGTPVGRVVAVLFSEEVTPASVQDRLDSSAITNYAIAGNRVVGVALQPGRRIAFVALRDPYGPFIPRQITISNVSDARGNAMAPWTGAMEATVPPTGGVVSGRVMNADGTAVPLANVRLFTQLVCESDEPNWVGISSKPADEAGRYQFDYVPRLPDRILAVNQETGEARNVRFNVQRDGQRLNVDVVYLGRGTVKGMTFDERGRDLADTAVRVSSLTDGSEYGARTDANGRFSIPGVPVGNVFIEAVNVLARAQFSFADFMPAAGASLDRNITLLDVEKREITVKQGALSGHVLRADNVTTVAGVPVIVWYKHLSQDGVRCPGEPAPSECAIAMATTDALGGFAFDKLTAGDLRISTFDQGALSEGRALITLPPSGSVQVNVLLGGGLGTVKGVVLDAAQHPVQGAVVGGGLSLTTTDQDGRFTLLDVPVGRRDIVAVSEALGAKGSTTIDIVQAGQEVNATITFAPLGAVSGLVVAADGVTRVPNVKVWLFSREGGSAVIAGSATTDANGGFQIPAVVAGNYQLSAFKADFSDGNIVPASIKFQGQTFRTTIRFRGTGGRLSGRVLDDDGVTPLKARVGISGDQVVVAGNQVAVGFERVNYFRIVDTNFQTGAFSFSNLFVGPVTISAVGQFSPDPVSATVDIPAPNAQVSVDLKLQATSQIHGAVMLPNGVQPAGENLVVRYKSEAYKVICSEDSLGESSCESIPQGIQEENAVTDAQGRFWFPVVNAGPFSITIEDVATGATARIQGSVRPGEDANLTARLLARSDVTVQVLGSNRTTQIAGARVKLQQLGYPQRTIEGTADTQGIVQFAGGDAIAEGAFVVTATDPANGFAGRARGEVTTSGDPLTVKVYLYDAAGTVSGTVFAPDGFTPVPNAEVTVSGAFGPLAFSVTGADGRYSVGTVPLGPVSIEVFEARTGRRGAASGRVDAGGQSVNIDVVEASIGVVRGQVLQAGTFLPLKGWEVTLSQQSAGGLALPSLKTTTGVDGRFSFPGASRGTFTIVASRQSIRGSGRAQGWIDAEGQVTEVPVLVDIARTLTGGITGVVVNASGQPVGNTAIEICTGSECGGRAIVTTAASDGTFVANDVPLGRFSVVARAQVSGDSGSAFGELVVDGDVASVTVVLSGLAKVSGTVVRADQSAAGNVQVTLSASPSSGCSGDCVQSTNGQGEFSFAGVPGKTFTVTVVDPSTGLKGVGGGSLQPGEQKSLRIVLEPTAQVTGRVLTSAGLPAQGAVAELIVDAGGPEERRLYREAGADGTFTFPAAPLKNYQLQLADPIGPGIASRQGRIVGALDLGSIVLDEAAPQVASTVPGSGAKKVALNANVVVTFTEPILPGTINATNVTLLGPNGAVTATLDVTTNDTVVVIDPLQPLQAETVYTVRIKDVKDRVQKVMPSTYVATFTTLDITPPAITEASPRANDSGVTIYTPIRIKFSEPIDTGRFDGAPIVMSGPAGPVAGTIGYLFGNTVAVFTPLAPLSEAAVYQVTVKAATDLSGLAQASPTVYSFSTTTRTPPILAALIPGNNGQAIRGGVGRVTAQPGAGSDVLFVDFYVNGTLAGTDRTSPFELAFQVTPELGNPGDSIAVTAIPTDTSGNRGVVPASAQIAIVADQPPNVSVNLTVPGGTTSARNGDRIVVTVTSSDDLGIAQLGYRAAIGNPVDARTEIFTPTVSTKTSSFAFFVPETATPGSTIDVEASAIDTAGQVGQAVKKQITVLDAVAPAVEITGATTGATIRPGQATTVVVTASDIGGITGLTFTAGGLVTRTDTRTIDPAKNAVVSSFTVNVPSTARTGDTLTLDATATDRAGNTGTAARVILPIADAVAPVVQIQTASGSLDAAAGQTVQVVVSAEDEGLVSELRLAASGGMTFTSAKQVTPPSGSASRTFDVIVPPALTAGTTIQLTATAVDLAGNTSAPAALTLTVVNAAGVTLPASQIVRAGESVNVAVQLAAPAPAGGVRVDFATDDIQVATVTPFVQVAEGQTDGTIQVTGIAGGTTTVRALVQNVLRGTMTVAVSGGIVRGAVRDSQFNAVAGVQVTVSGGGVSKAAITEADGSYEVQGIVGPNVTVRALDPETRLRGYATGTMTHASGSLRSLNVILIPAVSVEGTVLQADGTTPAGAGVRVDISERAGGEPLATTFTDANSHYEFPLVTLGSYVLEASAVNGNRGRAAASLVETGAEVSLPIVYLGQGTIRLTVRTASGNTVANAAVTLRTWDAFGTNEPVQVNADGFGYFEFTNVPVGSFSIEARDTGTGQAGSVTGSLTQHLQVLEREVVTASYGSLHGKVFRADGQTIVVGARVSLGSRLVTTNELGEYRFEILPLGNYQISVSDPGTGGQGVKNVTLATNAADIEQNISLAAQGKLLITVRDAGGVAVPNAFVQVSSEQDALTAAASGTTGPEGTVLIERLLAGTGFIRASAGALEGTLNSVRIPADVLTEFTVSLQPTGTITGTVYEPGGQTPATTGYVRLNGWYGRTTPINPDGTYTFLLVGQGTHSLTVYDELNRARAISPAGGVTIATNGQTVTANFEKVGLGTVKGVVLFSDNRPAQDFGVMLRSLNPTFGGYQWAPTDGGGNYEITGVPVGAFTVSTSDTGQQVIGEAEGVVPAHNAKITADILLQNNAVTLPLVLTDGNGYSFDVQRDGSIARGGSAFGGVSGDQTFGANELTLVSGGVPLAFTGNPISSIEDAQREVVTRQPNLHGLTVTRKVFVPNDGYFTRELELLTNPGDQPVTVDVQIANAVRPAGNGSTVSGAATVVATSSGDQVFQQADRWVIVGQSSHVPETGAGRPARAFVTQGGGALQQVGTTQVDGLDPTIVRYAWQSIVVPPGQTVGLMHFIVQQTSDAAAQAAAERLVQLPREALVGLSPEELGLIRNFVVPADGSSSVPALPLMRGTITGRVLESDATTVVPQAKVSVVSSSVLYRRRFTVTAGNDGRFTIATQDTGAKRFIPQVPFTLSATYPDATTVVAPDTAGDFLVANTTATQDVTFSNTGQVSGAILRPGNVRAPGGSVTISGRGASYAVAPDASYRIGGLLPGTYTVTGTIPSAQGSPVAAVGTVTVSAGTNSPLDLIAPQTLAVTGTVLRASNAPAIGAKVKLTATGFSRETSTSTGGAFALSDVPPGTYRLEAIEPLTQIASATSVTVASVPVDTTLTLIPVGSVSGTITLNNTGAGGRTVKLRYVLASGAVGSDSTTTAGNGGYRFENVPASSFVVEVDDQVNHLYGKGTGQLATDGQDVKVNFALTVNTVSLPITLYDANGYPYDLDDTGAIINGKDGVFYGSGNGAGILQLNTGSVIDTFHADSVAVQEMGGRQIRLSRAFNGLQITRKIYVPDRGYFARFVDTFTNPTNQPITIGANLVNVMGNYNTGAGQLITSSSGDRTLTASADDATRDLWATFDDTRDVDPFLDSYGMTAVGMVWGGAGAALKPGVLDYRNLSYISGLEEHFDDLVVQPGQTVSLLHFVVQQASRAAAKASMERLAQLPPEALEGLTVDERAAIGNFVVPVDGQSAVPALPGLTGAVNGIVQWADGTQPFAGIPVTFKSAHPLFARSYQVNTSSNGGFSFTGSFATASAPLALPLADFTLTAQVPGTTLTTSAPGTFPVGQTTSTTNIVIASAGSVRGTLRRSDGSAVANVNVYDDYNRSVKTNGDGQFTFVGFAAGSHSFYADLPVPSGQYGNSTLTASGTAQVLAGQRVDIVLSFAPTGVLSGVVTTAGSTPIASVQIRAEGPTWGSWPYTRWTYSNGQGQYRLDDLVPGSYNVYAYDPRTGTDTLVAATTVSANQVNPLNVALAAVGSVTVTVVYPSTGLPAANSGVQFQLGPNWWSSPFVYTNSSGQATLTNVPGGAVRVRAFHPLNSDLQGFADGTLTNEGQNLPLTVTLPAVGQVRGVFTSAKGQILANQWLQVRRAEDDGFIKEVTTDQFGKFLFTGVPTGIPVRLYAWSTRNYGIVKYGTTFTLQSEGDAHEENISRPAVANVHVVATRANGQAWPMLSVQVKDTARPYFRGVATTGNDGGALIWDIAEGPFTVKLLDANTGVPLWTADGVVLPTDDEGQVELPVTVTRNTGTITGRVVASDGTTAIGNVTVRLLDRDSSTQITSVVTGADGVFSFPNRVFGAGGFLLVAQGPYGSAGQASGTVDAEQATVQKDVVLPVTLGTITGTVTAAGALPVGNVALTLHRDADYFETVYTAADGTYRIDNVLTGPAGLGLIAEYPGVSAEKPVQFTTQGQVLEVNFTFDLVQTNLTVQVFAGDGQTPVESADVDARTLDGVSLGYGSTNANGQTVLNGLWVPPGGFQVLAGYTYNSNDASATVPVPVPQPSATVVLQLPMSVVRGRVTAADGSAVSRPTVFTEGADGVTRQARRTKATGDYVVFGTVPGEFTITAQDRNGVIVTVQDTMQSENIAVVRDLSLPATSTVTGRVFGPDGQVRPFTSVSLIGSGLAYDRWEDTDENGVFTFADVPVGAVSLFASLWEDSQTYYLSANGTLTATSTLSLDLHTPDSTALTGHVVDAQGVAQPFADVQIYAYTGAGPLGYFDEYVQAGPEGEFSMSRVPQGRVKIVATSPSGDDVGVLHVTASAATTDVEVRYGTGVSTDYSLFGSNGLVVALTDVASMNGGGTSTTWGPLSYTYEGYLVGDYICCDYYPALDNNGRQLTFGPIEEGSGLFITRKVLMPEDGRFVRYLEIVENTTGIPRQVTVDVDANSQAPASSAKWLVTPDNSGRRYVVSDDTWNGATPRYAAVGHVMAGAGTVAASPRINGSFESGNSNYFQFGWQTTVPANSRVAFLHYIVLRDADQGAAAVSQSESLVNLSDPEALAGLTAEEKALIRNFNLP